MSRQGKKGKTKEGKGGPKRSTHGRQGYGNKRKASFIKKADYKKKKTKAGKHSTGKVANKRSRQSSNKNSKFNINMKKKLKTKTYQNGTEAWSMEHGAWKQQTEYNDWTKSEGKHRD